MLGKSRIIVLVLVTILNGVLITMHALDLINYIGFLPVVYITFVILFLYNTHLQLITYSASIMLVISLIHWHYLLTNPALLATLSIAFALIIFLSKHAVKQLRSMISRFLVPRLKDYESLSELLSSISLYLIFCSIALAIYGYYGSPLNYGTEFIIINICLSITFILSVPVRIPSIMALGIASSAPLIGLPIISLIASIHSITYTEISEEGVRDIVLGNIVAELEYGIVRNVYRGIDQGPIISRRKGKVWFWKSRRGLLRINYIRMPNRHVVIFGSSGMGKSSLAKAIVIQCWRNYKIPFMILDYHNEYVDLLGIVEGLRVIDASTTSINPFELSQNISPRRRSIELADLIQSIFGLGYIQRRMLEDAFMEAYRARGILEHDRSTWLKDPPTFNDVLTIMEELSVKDPSYTRIIPYIRMLAQDVFYDTRLSVSEIVRGPTVILLANLPSFQVKVLYVDTLLNKLANLMYQHRLRDMIIVIDEAHILLRRGRSRDIVSKMFRESRKYGIGIIAITQQPIDVDESVILNTSIKIVFNIGEHRNLEYISKTLSGYLDPTRIQLVRLALASIPRLNAIVSVNNKIYLIDASEVVKECLNIAV